MMVHTTSPSPPASASSASVEREYLVELRLRAGVFGQSEGEEGEEDKSELGLAVSTDCLGPFSAGMHSAKERERASLEYLV